MELTEQFITDLDNVARAVGADGLLTFVRLLSIGVQQRTSLLRISDRWLMRDLDMNQHAVTAAKRSISEFVHVDASHGRTTTYLLPLPFPAQPCVFPGSPAVFHISTGAPDLSTAAPLPAMVHAGIPATSADTPAVAAPLPAMVHAGIPATSADIPAMVQGQDGTDPSPSPQDTRARDESKSSREVSSCIGSIDRVRAVARSRSINPSQMAEGEAVRTRLTALLRRNAAHPNSILPADDTITAQVLAIAPHTRLLRELDKLDKESHPVNDSYGYLVFVLINRILGVDRHTIRDVFAQVRAERARQRSGQLQLDDYGMDPAALGRKLA